MRDAAKRKSARRVRINTLDMREFIRFHRLAKVSAIDVGARVVHSRSSINTRGFCKANRSQLFFTSAYTHTLSLSLTLYTVLYFIGLPKIHGDLVITTIWRSQRDQRNISSESQFSERRIESPLDAYGYRVLLVIY